MSSATTLTGRNGKFTVGGILVARITQWAINPTLASSTEWGDSDSAGYTSRAPGRKDCTFTAEGKYDKEDAGTPRNAFNLFQPGDIVAAILYFNTTTLPPYYSFTRALCTDFNLTVNVDTEEVIGWTSSWGADGAYTLVT